MGWQGACMDLNACRSKCLTLQTYGGQTFQYAFWDTGGMLRLPPIQGIGNPSECAEACVNAAPWLASNGKIYTCNTFFINNPYFDSIFGPGCLLGHITAVNDCSCQLAGGVNCETVGYYSTSLAQACDATPAVI